MNGDDPTFRYGEMTVSAAVVTTFGPPLFESVTTSGVAELLPANRAKEADVS